MEMINRDASGGEGVIQNWEYKGTRNAFDLTKDEDKQKIKLGFCQAVTELSGGSSLSFMMKEKPVAGFFNSPVYSIDLEIYTFVSRRGRASSRQRIATTTVTSRTRGIMVFQFRFDDLQQAVKTNITGNVMKEACEKVLKCSLTQCEEGTGYFGEGGYPVENLVTDP